MMRIRSDIVVPEDAFELKFVRSSGPGGQHVNKVATAVQLRLDLTRAGLPEDVRARLQEIAGSRLTAAGELIVHAERHRSQERNRRDALERVRELLERAARPPRERTPTRPSPAARRRRTDAKKRRGRTKRLRKRPAPE